MKKLTNFISVFAIILFINGQWAMVNGQTISTQKGLTYQAVARNASGNIIANQSISVRFSLLTGSATGPVYYQETQSLTTNTLGLFNTTIFVGVSVTTTGTFNPAAWQVISSLGAFIKVEMDITGGSTYTDMGTTQLLSVPFALYAESSGVTPGAVTYKGTWDADNNTPDLALSAPVKGYYYVVTVAGTTSLTGIDDWNVGDWAVYNGTTWNKIAGGTPGAVTFKGTWNAITNTPPLSNGAGTKGFYYVVATPGSTSLNGISDWGTGDWVIYNGTAWGKVDNSDAVSDGENISGSGAGVFKVKSNTLLQFKKLTNSDGSAVVQDNPNTIDIGVQFDDAGTSASRTWSAFKINSELNSREPIITGTGSINDFWSGAKTFRNLGTDVRALPLTGLSLATNQVISASNTVIQAFGYLQKQISDNLSAITAAKVDRAGDTMTGDLILNADPSSALGAATKQYVDATATGLGIANKADKVVGATNGHFAGLDANGNLTDSGKNPSSFLPSSTTATNIPFTPSGNIISANVQDAIAEVDADFADVIDSYIHQTEDGVYIYEPSTGIKRFGIGVTQPDYPLGIKAEGTNETLISFHDPGVDTKWLINLNPSGLGNPGFNMDQRVGAGNVSRLFIQESDGYVGMGTITPSQKLHIEESVSAGITGLQIRNTATAANNGFVIGHRQSTVSEQDGAFAIFEQTASGAERLTIRPGGNVGISQSEPDTKLHVSRSSSDPLADVSLSSGSGIVVIGSTVNNGIDSLNIAMDAHSIQVRRVLSGGWGWGTFDLQRLGGDILIHGDDASAASKAIITEDVKLGLGTITPAEKIDIDGAIKIGTTVTNNTGTIRWSGSDFEGYDGGSWKSFTNSFWSGTLTLGGQPAITYNAADPKVGIGVAQPAATLDVSRHGASISDHIVIHVSNTCDNNAAAPQNRIGIKVSNTGQWSSSPLSKDIGLYVSNITGQNAHESNLAAVLNGNVVIGDVTTSPMIGTNGKNVLGFQNGDIPTQAIVGIQLYSAPNTLGTPVFNVMTGDGHVIQLFRSSAITAPDNSSVGSTYGTNEQTIISNMRDRINALEARLQAFGLLE